MRIKSIKKLTVKHDRYDLTVGETSNFFANGILIHNTSAVYSNILCKKKFSLWRFFMNKLGRNIPDVEYRFVYSSRSILKSKKNGEWTDDVWGAWAEKLNGEIPEGYSVYGEIAGFTRNGKTIQKNYDYGASLNESKFYVYRMTRTNAEGVVEELDWNEIQKFCFERDLYTVPVYFNGIAKDMFDISTDDNWNNEFLAKLKETYLDKPCEFCTTGEIREGVVVKINSREKKPVFKFKSPMFDIMSSHFRDIDYDDMEELS